MTPEQMGELIGKLEADNGRLRDALMKALQMMVAVLPEFNWGASCLSAESIRLLNETPGDIRRALSAAPQTPQETDNV